MDKEDHDNWQLIMRYSPFKTEDALMCTFDRLSCPSKFRTHLVLHKLAAHCVVDKVKRDVLFTDWSPRNIDAK